jgi:hypothetical protein
MGLGGLAFAAGGVPFIDDGADTATAESREAELPDVDPTVPDRVEGSEKDDVEAEALKKEIKDEPVKDEPVKDEPKEEEPKEDESKKDEESKDEKEDPKDEPNAEAPELAILYPENGAKVDDEKMVFEGETTPGARVFAGKWEADVKDDGAWRIVLILEPGTQTAKFRAESDGGVAEAAVTITRIVPDKPKEEPSEYELVAHQVYGECDAEVPYDVFWGETAPNAHVLVWSEYGSAETYANSDGQFELQVEFPNAPYGKAFQVKVKSIDQKRYFDFVGYGHSYELVAHQVHGASEAELPFDVFWGETKPNAHVLVWSEYGSAETYANGDGQFELRVDFPEAPYGVEFQVKVKSIEQKRYFGFTSYGNPPDGEGGGAGA